MYKKMRLWMCKHLGWHTIGTLTEFDGCSQHAICKWCKYEGMIDSQGNLF